jgi:hypothetical protein
MFYAAYGAVLSSTVPLPELSVHGHADPDLFVTSADDTTTDAEWHLVEASDQSSARWLTVASGPCGYRLVFDGGGEFIVSVKERRITSSTTAADAATVRHLLIDQVVPLVLAHAGRLVLHASGIETPVGAMALIGPAGAGKSTLTASFGVNGAPVLADDALVVERRGGEWLAVPAYAGIRIWPDVIATVQTDGDSPRVAPYTEKRRLGPAEGLRFCRETVPLRRIYVLDLEEVDRITLVPLSGREALMAVVAHTFTLDASDTARAADQLDRAHALCRDVSVKRLQYPRRLDILADVREVIFTDART